MDEGIVDEGTIVDGCEMARKVNKDHFSEALSSSEPFAAPGILGTLRLLGGRFVGGWRVWAVGCGLAVADTLVRFLFLP